MKTTKLPAEKAKHIDPETKAPRDWAEPISGHGYSRNEAQKFYLVRLTVQGKQHFISCEYCQDDAAKAYDLALWKMAPKMTRVLKPNDKTSFEFITQAEVDRFCPRINELYETLPFLTSEDEELTEEVLRNRSLHRRYDERVAPGLNDFQDALFYLKRFRITVVEASARLFVERSKLPYLHKLPEASRLWSLLIADVTQAEARLMTLEQSLEAQRAYYLKLVQSGEVPN